MQGTATDGTTQLVVWLDERNALPAHTLLSDVTRLVVAARIDAHGNVLDVPNIVLPLHGRALPFWNGHEYVVVGSGQYVRISSSGELLDPQPRTFSCNVGVWSIAWGGGRLMIANRAGSGIHAAVYDASFNLVRDDFTIFDRATYGAAPAIASNGNGFMVAETANTDLMIAAIDRNGAIVRTSTVLHTQIVASPMIASDGERYLVMARTASWYGYSYSNLRFVSFSIGGNGVVSTVGPMFGNPPDFNTVADLKWQGDRYALVIGSVRYVPGSLEIIYGIDSVTLDRDASAGNAVPLVVTPGALPFSAIVSGGNGPRMLFWSTDIKPAVYETWPVMNGQPYSDPASFAASNTQRFVLGQGSLSQESPAVATAGEVSLLVWRERESPRDRLALYAARIDRFGTLLDAHPMRISDVTCDNTVPAVVSNGHDFLVAWKEALSIRAVRLGQDGRMLDPAPIVVSTEQTATECLGLAPQLAVNGSEYLVAWGGVRSPGDGVALLVKRMAFDGTLLDGAPFGIAPQNGGPLTELRVASDGKDFFIAWTEYNKAFGSRFTSDGLPRDIGGIPFVVPLARMLFWSGRNYVLVSPSDSGRLKYQRISREGQRLDALPPLLSIQNPSTRTDVNCDSSGCFMYQAENGAITATRFDDTPSGLVAETKPFAPFGDADWRQAVVFGDALKNVAYLRMVPEAPYAGSWHLFIRSMLAGKGRAVR